MRTILHSQTTFALNIKIRIKNGLKNNYKKITLLNFRIRYIDSI